MPENAEMIYQSLCGNLIHAVPGAENLFGQGSECDAAYRRAQEAYGRLLARLGEEDKGEDDDVELIIDSFITICHNISIKMYEYCEKTTL